MEDTPAIVVDRACRNFDQIKAGDELVVTHVEALTLEQKNGAKASASASNAKAGERTPIGAKPGMAEVNRARVVANVVAVITRTQTVTLGGVAHTVDLRIADKNRPALIEVGDPVKATYTEAVAVPMECARKQ